MFDDTYVVFRVLVKLHLVDLRYFRPPFHRQRTAGITASSEREQFDISRYEVPAEFRESGRWLAACSFHCSSQR
jgi:hypothetical protein